MDAAHIRHRRTRHEARSRAIGDCPPQIVVGNVDRPLLCELLSIFSAYLATFLSSARAPLFTQRYVEDRRRDVFAGRLVFPNLRLAFGPMDFRWCHADARSQDFHGRGNGLQWAFPGGLCGGARQTPRSAAAFGGRVVWLSQFEPQRGDADPGRSPRRGTMDGRAELCREPGGRGCTRTHRISGWADWAVLLALPDHVGDCLDWSDPLGFRGGSS